MVLFVKSIPFTLRDCLLYSCKGGMGLGSLSLCFNYSASFRIVFLVGLPTSNDGIFDDCGCVRILIMLSIACTKKSLSLTIGKRIEHSMNSIIS